MSITAYKVAFTVPANFKSQGSFRTTAGIANTKENKTFGITIVKASACDDIVG